MESISQFVPVQPSATQYVRGKYDLFLDFVKAYYEWLEQDGNAVKGILTLHDQRDVDKCSDELFKYFHKKYLTNIPTSAVVDRRLLLKHIKDFYRARGSEKSFRLLFRILFDKPVEFYYPKVDILKLSDGKWQIDTVIRTTTTTDTTLFPERQITGVTSGATADVEAVTQVTVGEDTVSEIRISNLNGDFAIGETVEVVLPDGSTAQETTYGILTGVTLSDRGTGYSVGDIIPVSGANTTGQLEVEIIDSVGAIKKVKVKDFGINYSASVSADFTGSGDGNAVGTTTFGAVGRYAGRYLNEDGFLSDNKYIQDSYYYQDFSYVLKSEIPISTYRNIVKKLLHPASFALFGVETTGTPTSGRPSADETPVQ